MQFEELKYFDDLIDGLLAALGGRSDRPDPAFHIFDRRK